MFILFTPGILVAKSREFIELHILVKTRLKNILTIYPNQLALYRLRGLGHVTGIV